MLDDNQTIMEYLIFQIDQAFYGLSLENVKEVVLMVEITRVPRAPAWLSGVVNVRGHITPIVDLRSRLGLSVCPPKLNTPIIITENKERTVGFIIDQVCEVIALPAQIIIPPDELTKKARPVKAISHMDDRLIIILDLVRLMAGTERFNTEIQPERENGSDKPQT